MGVLSISFARVDKITSNFLFTMLPQAIRLLILVIGVVTTSYRRLTSHHAYMSIIERNTSRFVKSGGHISCQCTICLGEIGDGEVGRRLPCQHDFHLNCLDPWLRSSGAAGCPLCRRPVLPGDAVAEYQMVQKLADDGVFEKELALILLSGLSSGGCQLKLPWVSCFGVNSP